MNSNETAKLIVGAVMIATPLSIVTVAHYSAGWAVMVVAVLIVVCIVDILARACTSR
jgi:hypothetical protein